MASGMSRQSALYGSTRMGQQSPTNIQPSNYWRTASFNPHHVRSSAGTSRRGHCWLWDCCNSFYSAKIITVEPVIFLFMFAYYFYKVIFELYVFNRYGQQALNISSNVSNSCISLEVINNYDRGKGNTVEGQLAQLTLIVGITARLPSALAALILGPLSDRFGRKPAILVTLLGMLLHAVVTILIVQQELNLYFFVLAGVLRGMCGGIAGMLTSSYSYIADVSSKKWLVVRLGLLEAMGFAAGTLSLVSAGVWSQLNQCDFRPLVWVLLGCMVVAIPYTLVLLPESKENQSIDDDDKKRPRPLTGVKALFRGFQIFFMSGYPRGKLWLLLVVIVVTILNTTGTTAIITLFLLHEPLGWSPIHIGGYLASSELMHGLSLIAILPILVGLGIKDSFITLIALVLSVGANVSLGFADSTWQVYTIGAIQSVDALILPGVKAIMSKTVSPVDHGALFSFVSAAQVLAQVLGYAVYVPVYTVSLGVQWGHASGIAFLGMAALYGFLLPVVLVIMCLMNKASPPTQPPVAPPASEQEPRVVSPLINTPSSEVGQDAMDRRSFYGSIPSHDHLHDFEQSFQSSGSYLSRSFH